MAIAYLENDLVRIGVKSHGAELCSFIKKSDQREYIWQAHPEFWNRHAPVLSLLWAACPKTNTCTRARPTPCRSTALPETWNLR